MTDPPAAAQAVFSMFRSAPVPSYRGWRFRVWWWQKRLRNRVGRRWLTDWEAIAITTQNALVHAEGANHEYVRGLQQQREELTRLHARLGLCVGESR